jgi:hypothetical protein
MTKTAKLLLSLVPACALAFAFAATGQQHAHLLPEGHKRQTSPKDAKVYIVNLKDGQTTGRKVKVIFGLTGMGIVPAGITASGQPLPDTGHHHLLLNADKLPPMDQPLAMDQPQKYLHFGKGQTETVLELPPGKHTLQLLFADYAHVPHDPPVISEKITINVQ